MKVTLTQSYNQHILTGWIIIRLETDSLCTQIWSSVVFNPYRELYIWLGKIRDFQFPSKIFIDEEGCGVELIAEQIEGKLINFRVEPWMCKNNKPTRLKIKLSFLELLRAFYNGISEFITNDYQPLAWSTVDNISNINWKDLLIPRVSPGQNWQLRLAMYGGGHGQSTETGRKNIWQNLTTEQQWLIALHDVLDEIALLAANDQKQEAFALVALYQEISIDLALDEFQAKWHEQKKAELEARFGEFKLEQCEKDRQRRRHVIQTRFATLEVGQLVDGRVSRIREDSIFVDICGYHALLHKSTISQLPMGYNYFWCMR